jgi:acyl-CoA hydrolase
MSEAKHSIAASRTEMTQLVMPPHTNGARGVMFGGVIMQWVDICGGVAAMKHASGDVVTASIDRLDFLEPIFVGDIVILRAQVNGTFKSSMEVGCRVEAMNRYTGATRYTTKAYLTFVAMDEHGRPRVVEPVIAESDDDRAHLAAAARRREERLRLAGRMG